MFSALSIPGFRVLGSGDDPVYPMFIIPLSDLDKVAGAGALGYRCISGIWFAAILANSKEAEGLAATTGEGVVMECCIEVPAVAVMGGFDDPNGLGVDPKPRAARLNMSYALLVEMSPVPSRLPGI